MNGCFQRCSAKASECHGRDLEEVHKNRDILATQALGDRAVQSLSKALDIARSPQLDLS